MEPGQERAGRHGFGHGEIRLEGLKRRADTARWLQWRHSLGCRVLRPRGSNARRVPAGSRAGSIAAFTANRRPNHDIDSRSGIYVVEVATGAVTTIAGGPDPLFIEPAWLR